MSVSSSFVLVAAVCFLFAGLAGIWEVDTKAELAWAYLFLSAANVMFAVL